MSNQRHPDIEIYVKDCSVTQLKAWLATLGTLSASAANSKQYNLLIDEHNIPVMIHERVAGKAWNSLWFKSDQTPWPQDIDCAKAASIALNSQVRCIATGWQTGDDPDEWWKVDGGEATLIQWR